MRFFLFLTIWLAPFYAFAQAEFVVVPRSAVLYASNEPGSPKFVPNETEGYQTFEFVERRGNRFRIRTVREDYNISCYDHFEFGGNFEVDFWVQSKDVMWVTKSSISERFDGGTYVNLQPGVVMIPGSSSDEWYADVGALLPITTTFVSRTFFPPKRLEQKWHEMTFTQGAVYLGDREAKSVTTLVGEKFKDFSNDTGLIRGSSICYEFVLQYDGILEKMMTGYGMSGHSSYYESAIIVGTPLFWRSGKLAGRAVGHVKLDGKTPSASPQDLICYEFVGQTPNARVIELCVQDDDISRRKPR